MTMANFRYASREKCLAEKRVPTNPRYPNFIHRLFTAGDEEQFFSARSYSSLSKGDAAADLLTHNRFIDDTLVDPWSKHTSITSRAVADTFRYFFYKFKKGVFVKIKDNQLVTFLPFANVHFKNEWHDLVKVDPRYPNVKRFIDQASKRAGYMPPAHIKPVDEWVANNSIIRFDYQDMSDNNVAAVYDMFKTLCNTRKIADVEVFINRRDYPILTRKGTEPYYHLYGGKDEPLRSHNYSKYAPVLSGSSNDWFADILTPTYEDWTRVVYQTSGLVMPNACRSYPEIRQIPWESKLSKAVFRGASTGAGSTPETNQRLKVLEMADADYMDVGITKWNLRPRKHETDTYFRLIERSSYPTVAALDLQEQSRYKYILTLEGHVAAYRLSYELSSGSVVLLADSSWRLWYYKFLKPYVHYVPVAQDLSDLKEKILWCRQHDDECRQIAAQARHFYATYLSMDGVLDYLQKELFEISTMTGPYAYLPNLLESQLDDETRQLNTISFTPLLDLPYAIAPGPRCIGRLDGTLKMFRAVPFHTFKIVKQVAANKNGTVHLAHRNNVYVAVKTATNPGKAREHRHEAYVGLYAVNSIVADVPNFAYTYGCPEGNDRVCVTEFVQGTPMNEWLQGPQFSFDVYLSLLIQINMALKVAQDHIGFIHYDLFPWNIIVQQLPFKVEFDYHVRPGVVLRCNTNVIPIIIDYGKSRAVIFEEGKGLVDHGFVNLYRSHSMTDTITMLITSLNLLRRRLTTHQFNTLQSYLLHVGLEANIEKYKHYGDLFNLPPSELTPMNFVDFVVNTFNHREELRQINPVHKLYKMEKGNPIQTLAYMKSGDENAALMETVTYINESTFPNSTDAFFQRVIEKHLVRRMSTLIDDINRKGSPLVKERFKTIYGYMLRLHAPVVEYPEIQYVMPDHVYLDADVDPEYVRRQMQTATPVKENMAIVWKWCADAFLWETPEGKRYLKEFVNIDIFSYLNAIASQNTLAVIYHKNEINPK